ncbi:protein DOG1-like 4 [Senna tora]|uniref:Protein DOG1-like 4 n=1 Tax=Senna tora TaxID=362788 RepID=A0A835CNB0_9FABA|nr:protein DOG1-like 4 [Senna tora]
MTDANAASSSFEAFLEGWMVRQKDYLDELVSAQQRRHEMHDDERRDLISRVLSHYEQYFAEKSKIAHRDILLVFSPPWFSSLERSFLWIAGFKPTMMIQLAIQALDDDLSEDQRQRLSEFSQETKMEERALNDELAKIHESVAAPPLVEAARSHGRLCLSESVIAEESGGGEVRRALKIALENLVGNADTLRIDTALKVMKILKPYQAVNALIAVAELQIKIRTSGTENDAHGGGGG